MSVASARLCISAAQELISGRFPVAGTLQKGAIFRSSTTLHVRNIGSKSKLNSAGIVQYSPLSNLAKPQLRIENVLRKFSIRAAAKEATDQPTGMAAPKEISSAKHFGGYNKRYEHHSSTIGVPMKFTVYLPPAAEKGKVPVGTLSDFFYARVSLAI